MPGPVGVPTVTDALEARAQVKSVIRYLRNGRDEEFHLIENSLPFESGALHALEWMLGLSGGVWFARHLAALKLIEPELTGKRRADDRHSGSEGGRGSSQV